MADEDTPHPPPDTLEDNRVHPFRNYIHPDRYPETLDKLSKFIRRTFVLPFRVKEPPVYYHRKYERVPTIDKCEIDDALCIWEAEEQWLRDKKVDNQKLRILRKRLTECYEYWHSSGLEKCKKEKQDWDQNTINWFLKYGDLARTQGPVESYMKQKHRMIFLRRKAEQGVEVPYNTDNNF